MSPSGNLSKVVESAGGDSSGKFRGKMVYRKSIPPEWCVVTAPRRRKVYRKIGGWGQHQAYKKFRGEKIPPGFLSR